MKYFHFIPAACIFLFCQCGGQDSHFLSDTKYIPVFSEDSCQYIDHGDNLHFTEHIPMPPCFTTIWR